MATAKSKSLPVEQLSILALCRLAEPIALTSVLPYLSALLRTFHIPESDIAFHAGLLGTLYALANALTAVPWGELSDRIGRKPVIVLGMTCNALMAMLWGFSVNLPMALVARFLAGAGNGNVGVMRSMVPEMGVGVGKAARARMSSVLPMVYSLGAIIGPAYGGALANPLHRPVDDATGRSDLLWRFPFALPNIICSVLFLCSAALAFLFLRETLAKRRETRDYGIKTGKKLKRFLRRAICRGTKADTTFEDGEHEPLLGNGIVVSDQETSPPTGIPNDEDVNNAIKATRRTFTEQTVICLAVYSLVPITFFTYDQQISWLLAYPRSVTDIHETLPLSNLSRGFGLSSKDIGLFFAASAVAGIINMPIGAMIYGKYGTLRCLRLALMVMPIRLLLAPFCALQESRTTALALMLALAWVKSFCTAIVYPCTTILVQDSAPAHEVLGTINGVGTTTSAIGRAIGPLTAGPAFSYGAKHGYIFMSFWIMALVSIGAPLVTLWVNEKSDAGSEESSE